MDSGSVQYMTLQLNLANLLLKYFNIIYSILKIFKKSLTYAYLIYSDLKLIKYEYLMSFKTRFIYPTSIIQTEQTLLKLVFGYLF